MTSTSASSSEATLIPDHLDDGRQHQREMIEACKVGDSERLQKLLNAAGVKKGDLPVRRSWISYPDKIEDVPASGPAATCVLIGQSVWARHAETTALLLEIYPTFQVREVLWSALDKPDLVIFKLLHARDPSIVNCEIDSGPTVLAKALDEGKGSPELVDYLLENGADPNERGRAIFLPIYFAIRYDYPLSLIKKMVGKGAWAFSHEVVFAAQHKRIDVAIFLLYNCVLNGEDRLEENGARQHVQELGDKELTKAFEWRVKLARSRST